MTVTFRVVYDGLLVVVDNSVDWWKKAYGETPAETQAESDKTNEQLEQWNEYVFLRRTTQVLKKELPQRVSPHAIGGCL